MTCMLLCYVVRVVNGMPVHLHLSCCQYHYYADRRHATDWSPQSTYPSSRLIHPPWSSHITSWYMSVHLSVSTTICYDRYTLLRHILYYISAVVMMRKHMDWPTSSMDASSQIKSDGKVLYSTALFWSDTSTSQENSYQRQVCQAISSLFSLFKSKAVLAVKAILALVVMVVMPGKIKSSPCHLVY